MGYVTRILRFEINSVLNSLLYFVPFNLLIHKMLLLSFEEDLKQISSGNNKGKGAHEPRAQKVGAYTLLPWHQACLGVLVLPRGRNLSPL